jgi:small subunit ribosomal protein S27e
VDIFWNCLALRIGHFVNWFCSCLTKVKAVWNSLKLPFVQFNVTFYWFLTPSFQPFSPWMSRYMDLRKVLEFNSSRNTFGYLHPYQSEAFLLPLSTLAQTIQDKNWCLIFLNVLGCYKITTVFSHAQTVVLCVSCSTVLCQPTGGRARLTEGGSFSCVTPGPVVQKPIANSQQACLWTWKYFFRNLAWISRSVLMEFCNKHAEIHKLKRRVNF